MRSLAERGPRRRNSEILQGIPGGDRSVKRILRTLEEEGPAVSAGAVPLFFRGVGLGGEVGSSACFPLDLSPAEDLGTGTEESVAPIDGGNPRSPKSSSADNT